MRSLFNPWRNNPAEMFNRVNTSVEHPARAAETARSSVIRLKYAQYI
jgi:hypothetical protein